MSSRVDLLVGGEIDPDDATMTTVIRARDVLLQCAKVTAADGGPEPLPSIARLLVGCGFPADLVAAIFDAGSEMRTDLGAAVEMLAKLDLVHAPRPPTIATAQRWLSLVSALREVASPSDVQMRIVFSSPRDFRCERLGPDGWGPSVDSELFGIERISSRDLADVFDIVLEQERDVSAPPPEQSIARLGVSLEELARASSAG